MTQFNQLSDGGKFYIICQIYRIVTKAEFGTFELITYGSIFYSAAFKSGELAFVVLPERIPILTEIKKDKIKRKVVLASHSLADSNYINIYDSYH